MEAGEFFLQSLPDFFELLADGNLTLKICESPTRS